MPTWDSEIWQFGRNIQNGVRNLYFRNFVLKIQFLTDFKNLDCIRSVFLLSNFCWKNFFSKIQNGGFFEDDVIFEKKSTFFQKVLPSSHPKLDFFQILKKQSCIAQI
jgi:hypothetical protein